MASPAVLRPAVDDLLDALRIRAKEFLPADGDPPHPFIPRPDFNRGNSYEVIKGEKPLTAKMARKLRKRLQLLLEFAIDDREELERIVAERAGYERTPTGAREAKLLMLLGAAIRERSAPAARIEERREAVRRVKAERAAYGGNYTNALLEKLDAIIAERKLRGNSAQLNDKLRLQCEKPDGLLTWNKGRYDIVDEKAILSRFGARPGQRELAADSGPADSGLKVLELTWHESPEAFPREQLLRFAEILRQNGFEVMEVERAGEGCTTVLLRVRTKSVGASWPLQEEELRRTGIVSLREEVENRGSGRPPQAGLENTPAASGSPPLLSRQLSSALRRDALARPWRRLYFLFSPRAAQSPLWHAIAESDDRAYAHPSLAAAWKALRVDLGMTLLLWPAVTVLALLLALLPLPPAAVGWGVLAGMALAMIGAQPCSALISPLACGAGVLVMGFSFGVVQAMIAARLDVATLMSRARILDDLFLSVDGGMIGLSAPSWRSVFPSELIVAMILGVALAIAIAGWLMGQPQRARIRVNHFTPLEELGGASLGAASGAGIGLVYGLDRLFRNWMPQPFAFMASFLIVAGTWAGFSAYLRFSFLPQKPRRHRAVLTAVVHSALAAFLVAAAFWSAGRPACPVVLAAACGFFQSTFFTAAFVISQRVGGVRAAFAATTLEGAIGFAAFVIARVWKG